MRTAELSVEESRMGFLNKAMRARSVLVALLAAGALVSVRSAWAADTFMKPTKEELAMTSLPGYPGAPAVVLFREEITRDDMHVVQHYDRIKILTEEGKSYANVDLPFFSSTDMQNSSGDYVGDDKMLDSIVGRTIHPDGTIIPFTGKPYLKVMEKTKGYKVQEKVFTLPDVEVGSIIEYRYSTRYNDNVYESPDWYIQGELFLKAAHYVWYPTTRELVDSESGSPINAISWFPILPPGAEIQHHDLPGTGPNGVTAQIYELNIKDVPPTKKEEYMPPIASFSYRVLYNFTQYRTAAEYWHSEGKRWSKKVDSFVGPNSDLKAATEPILAGATTQDQKLRKIYEAVMALDNTDYSRTHGRQEDKAAGLGKVDNTADVLQHKRGSGTQLVELFVGMARAAGMKAYVMQVPDRSERLFTPGWLSMNQFDNYVAIVNVDGKEQFFAPGSRYCPYGHLPWWSTIVQGLRQTDGGTDFAQTPEEPYTFNRTTRVANLTMADDGSVKGTAEMTFAGSRALHWRQKALRGDEASLKDSLREDMEERLPKTLEVRVTDIKNIEDYEKPLLVNYEVKGSIGTPTGKRLVLPVELFAAESRAAFPHDKRELPVYFEYPVSMQDAIRIRLPKSLAIEASPASSKFDFKGNAMYSLNVAPAADNITVRRNFASAAVVVPTANYQELRTFYSQFEAKDKDSVVLKVAPVEASAVEEPKAN